MTYDVVIVGAGPAGAATAQILAREKLRVLIIDKKKEVGIPVQCGEYIPALLLREIAVSEDAIAQRINGLRVYFPDNQVYEFSAPGYLIHRSVFDKQLLVDALQHGAILWLKTEFLKIEHDKIWLAREGKIVKIDARILVGADGPNSRVNQLINGRYKDYVIAYQQELPLLKNMDYTEVYFDPAIFGGYGWVFPKKRTANVGIGVKTGHRIKVKELFSQFVARVVKEKKVFDSPVRITTGLIPVGGPVPKTVWKNILLVGDAAGQTHPITGAGIPQAVVCGKSAGRAIIKALKNNNLDYLISYEDEWRQRYFAELNRALQKRKKMEEEWDRLHELLKVCWVSFPEYYG
ncbi:MAG: NAD(P)/FAD-dependent oxidoreductase [candidate division WOR-3 bacterium]